MFQSNFNSNDAKDDWINEIDEEEDDDTFEYLYPTSARPQGGTSKTSTSIKKGAQRVDNVPNKSLSKPAAGTPTSSPQSPKLLRVYPPRQQSSYATNCGYPFIKRGKFKGFYDDRRYRCAFSNFDINRCNHSNCYCLHTPIVPSPLKYQRLDFISTIDEADGDIDEEHTDNNGDDARQDEQNSNDSRSLSSQFKKNRYKLSRVKHRSDDPKSYHEKSPLNASDAGSVSEKLSKRMRRYHSVNNLSKRASIRHHHLIEKDEEQEAPTLVRSNDSSSSKNHKHNYLRSLKSIDIGFYKPLTTTV